MMYFREATSQFITVHSAIGGPWMPELLVMGIRVSLTIGLERRWSTPADNTWMNLMLDFDSVC